jgi:aminopeptidase N
MRLPAVFLAAVLLPLAACNKPAPQEPAKPGDPTVSAENHDVKAMSSHDPNSYAEPEKVVITHLALELNVDFAKKVLAGSATYDLDWKDPAATTLVLDTRDLDVSGAEGFDNGAWTPLKFEVGAKDKIYGS